MNKLANQIEKLYDKYSEQEVLDAINYLSDKSIWTNMDSKQREEFFIDECKNLGLSIRNETNAIYVEEFRAQVTGNKNPYFMYWKARNSDNSKGGIEFGHWHMNRKWDKEFPVTEYCFGGPREQRAMMKKYVEERKGETNV
jgi:hypothetical protein